MSAKAILSASVSAGPAVYVEDVFSTFLYTGNGSTQTITNGIDLAGEGGLVWVKARNQAYGHRLLDSDRSFKYLDSSTTDPENVGTNRLSATSTGFSLDAGSPGAEMNNTNTNFCSWTFRKAPKFFDIQTWTGNGVTGRQIPHGLGSVPGCMIIKKTSAAEQWAVYHRSTGNTQYGMLNQTNAFSTFSGAWNNTTPTDTVFTVGNWAKVNESGQTYVGYFFAHDAGGFGDAGTDNVVSCGSYTGNGTATGPTVTLGWEPQWLLVKRATGSAGNFSDNWTIVDNMRGFPASIADSAQLFPNTSEAENFMSFGLVAHITSTGFAVGQQRNASGATYIYIAIRRGPMKVPTLGTSVYTMALQTPSAANNTNSVTSGFPVDLWITRTQPSPFADPSLWMPRLTTLGLYSTSTGSEVSNPFTNRKFDSNTGIANRTGSTDSASLYPHWMFRRAPGFFDVVAYTGTGSATTVSHNLGVAPELIIIKNRGTSSNWAVYVSAINANNWTLNLEESTASFNYALFSSAPTSSTMTFTGAQVNAASNTFIAYLFASCPGVSKVGSYTGTGTTKQINCGFTSGARFVLIKRTDSAGDWFVWDTTRGIISGNDPYLLLNSTAAQVTNTDYIDPLSSGFEISSTAPAAINANGGTYIFLAIA